MIDWRRLLPPAWLRRWPSSAQDSPALSLRSSCAIALHTTATEGRPRLPGLPWAIAPKLSERSSGPRARPLVEAALARARSELRLAATLTALRHDLLSFAGGERIAADAVVLT